MFRLLPQRFSDTCVIFDNFCKEEDMAAHASSEIIKYDVFLNFRGTDTRRGFLSNLRKALEDKHIKTYVDYMLREGTEISHSLLAAIEQSEIALIIFFMLLPNGVWKN
ncbi:hypothetical protein S83_071239 [Arachis hypogaea]